MGARLANAQSFQRPQRSNPPRGCPGLSGNDGFQLWRKLGEASIDDRLPGQMTLG